MASDVSWPSLSRGEFLRVATAGALAVKIGAGSAVAHATTASAAAPVTDIDAFYDAWQERFNAGDLDGLTDLYVEDVTYLNPDEKMLAGRSDVRSDFEGLLAIKPTIVLGNRKHLVYKDIALTTNHWRLNFQNPDGVLQEMTGGGIEVIQKQADGGWRFIIDDASRSAV
nr:DUF4440 domain-containing protein [Aurantiacibacter rhizosphaerae]